MSKIPSPTWPARHPDSPKMTPPNRPGTYLIRRALKNDSDPCDECLKRSHERQVMKVLVQRVIRGCFANNLVLLRKCTMVPWYHGTMVPWYRGTMVPWYHFRFPKQDQIVCETITNNSLNKNLHNLTLVAPF